MAEYFPFRVKLSKKYLQYAQVPLKNRQRQGTVLRENKGKSRYVVLWDGCKTGHYIAKSFVQRLRNQQEFFPPLCFNCGPLKVRKFDKYRS